MKHHRYLRAAAILLTSAICCASVPAASFEAATETIEERLRNGWSSMTSTIYIREYGLNLSELTERYYETLYSNPEYFYVSTTFNYPSGEENSTISAIRITYSGSRTAVSRQKEELSQKVSELVGNLHADWTDAEKVLYFHDYLASHCEYDFNYKNYDAYSALIGGKAVCQGYALAMCMLCRAADIPCYALASDTLVHMWNVVCADGKWYQLDVTNDDNVPNMLGSTGHTYLLRSDSFFRGDSNHSADDWHIFGLSDSISCGDDSYGTAFWQYALDAVTPLPDGSFLLTVQGNPENTAHTAAGWNVHASLTQARLGGTPEKLLTYYTYWPAPNNSVYTNCYSIAELWNGRIYYSTPTEIRSALPDGSDVQVFYQLSADEQAYGAIYGFTVDADGLLTYQLMSELKLVQIDEKSYTYYAQYGTLQLPPVAAETTTVSSASSVTDTTTSASSASTASETETTSSATVLSETTTTVSATETTTTASTSKSTSASTSKSTTASTSKSTSASTSKSTTASTSKSTSASTSKSTTASTSKSTSASTSKSSTASTVSTQETESSASSASETETTTVPTSATETTTASSETSDSEQTTTAGSAQSTAFTADSSASSSETTATVSVSRVKGDLDLNGLPELCDAVMLAKAIAGIESASLSVAARLNADCVPDGQLDQKDLSWLLRALAGFDDP